MHLLLGAVSVVEREVLLAEQLDRECHGLGDLRVVAALENHHMTVEFNQTHPFDAVERILGTDGSLSLHAVSNLLASGDEIPCAILLEKRDEVLTPHVAVDGVDLQFGARKVRLGERER